MSEMKKSDRETFFKFGVYSLVFVCIFGRKFSLILHLWIIDNKIAFFFLAFINKPEYIEIEMSSQGFWLRPWSCDVPTDVDVFI
jgi:hypothetical protein